MGTVDDVPTPSRDFKKNRNQSTTSAGSGSGNPSSGMYSQGLNSPSSMQNKPPHPPSLSFANSNGFGSRQSGQGYPEVKSPTLGKVGDEHRMVM